MRKLFKTNFKQRIDDFEKVAIGKEESAKLLGGFKEYKPIIYDHEFKEMKPLKVNNLLIGSNGQD
ncbi:hypothetical protein ACFSKL_01220 [Belliella marina]|uniref:Uncharacterized protein n=1 Tax=Belliella marina TaxID=1644146 RepID=A0ABW4VI91_9BACT